MTDFPNGARVLVVNPEREDSDPENTLILTPWVREIEGGYEVMDIHSESPPIPFSDEGPYESDELNPDMAWESEGGIRVLCFFPTEAAQQQIQEWRDE